MPIAPSTSAIPQAAQPAQPPLTIAHTRAARTLAPGPGSTGTTIPAWPTLKAIPARTVTMIWTVRESTTVVLQGEQGCRRRAARGGKASAGPGPSYRCAVTPTVDAARRSTSSAPLSTPDSPRVPVRTTSSAEARALPRGPCSARSPPAAGPGPRRRAGVASGPGVSEQVHQRHEGDGAQPHAEQGAAPSQQVGGDGHPGGDRCGQQPAGV